MYVCTCMRACMYVCVHACMHVHIYSTSSAVCHYALMVCRISELFSVVLHINVSVKVSDPDSYPSSTERQRVSWISSQCLLGAVVSVTDFTDVTINVAIRLLECTALFRLFRESKSDWMLIGRDVLAAVSGASGLRANVTVWVEFCLSWCVQPRHSHSVDTRTRRTGQDKCGLWLADV